MRIALGLQYNGALFSGWQSQPHRNTVQDALERALAAFARTSVSTITAGRTDAGVHALEQIVHFDTDIKRAEFSWVRGLNAFLPDSVAVQWAHAVPDAFHARLARWSDATTMCCISIGCACRCLRAAPDGFMRRWISMRCASRRAL